LCSVTKTHRAGIVGNLFQNGERHHRDLDAGTVGTGVTAEVTGAYGTDLAARVLPA
jgi:hypothetical protein